MPDSAKRFNRSNKGSNVLPKCSAGVRSSLLTRRDVGFLFPAHYLIHDRDSKFCASIQLTIEAVGIKTVKLPARSPNLNSFAERWVKSAKNECLSKLILLGERSLRLALRARAKITSHFGTPIHPVWLRCSSVIYLDIIHFSRLARRTPRRPKMRTYSCADP